MRRLTSQQRTAVPIGSGKLLAAIAMVAVGVSMPHRQAFGQTPACKDVMADMAAQQKMIGIFRTLDYQIREHFLIEANAILSTYGGWNSIERGNEATNATKLRDTTTNFELQASVATRDIGLSKAVTEDERQTLNDAVDIFRELIDAGERIAEAIDHGKVDVANQIYYEVARPNYLQAHGTLYTVIATAEKRMASMARTQCN